MGWISRCVNIGFVTAEDVTTFTRRPRFALLKPGHVQGRRIHGDPADRLIVGTALVHGAVLISKDERIQGSGRVEIIW